MSPMKLYSQGMLGKLGAKDETREGKSATSASLPRSFSQAMFGAQPIILFKGVLY